MLRRSRLKLEVHESRRRSVTLGATLALSWVLITWRSWAVIGRLPSDPGYDYFLEANERGLRSVVGLDPYLHVSARLIAYLVSHVGLENQVLITGLVVNAAWALGACGIAYAVEREVGNSLVGGLSGMALVLCPAASESALTNIGNVKWPLTALTVVLFSAQKMPKRSRWWSVAILFIVGVSQPLTILFMIPLLFRFRSVSHKERRDLIIPITVVVLTTVLQILIVGWSRIIDGHGSSRILRPWPGMGWFWWFGLISPVVIALVSIVVCLVVSSKLDFARFIVPLSVTSMVIAITSYVFGGIADRYFVAPMTLGWISAILILYAFWTSQRRSVRCLTGAGAVALLLPIVYWFPASTWLTTGPVWSQEIDAAKRVCLAEYPAELEVQATSTSTVTLGCSRILAGGEG